MQTVTLGRHVPVTTTRLGFGTAGLFREPSKRRRLAILSAALDAGIRHFDTAPLYGLGDAERLLGEFLQSRSESVTIATKFGLVPSATATRLAPVQAAGRALLKTFPRLRRLARRSAQQLQSAARFDVATARASLESSLAALRRDRVDIVLLHECTPGTVRDPALLAYLEDLSARNRIAAFGTATNYVQTIAMLAAQPAYCAVIQFDSDVLTQNVLRLPSATTAAVITHSVLTPSHGEIAGALRADETLRSRWSSVLDADVATPHVLSRLLLQAALHANPRGLVLVHSNSPQHIAANAAAAQARADPAQLAELRHLLDAHLAARAGSGLTAGAVSHD